MRNLEKIFPFILLAFFGFIFCYVGFMSNDILAYIAGMGIFTVFFYILHHQYKTAK